MKLRFLIPAAVLFAIGAQAATVMLVFSETDKNGDGVLTKEEFLAAHSEKNPQLGQEQLLQAYAKKDLNKDGSLTLDEFMSDRKK